MNQRVTEIQRYQYPENSIEWYVTSQWGNDWPIMQGENRVTMEIIEKTRKQDRG